MRRLNELATSGTVTPDELDILHRIVCSEAGNEDALGQQLVVNVIMNRVNSPGFPDTIRGVVQAALSGEDNSRGALFFRALRGEEGSWHEQALQPLFDHGGHRFYTTRETASTPTVAS